MCFFPVRISLALWWMALCGAMATAQSTVGTSLRVLSDPGVVVSTEATETVVFQVLRGGEPAEGVTVTLSAPVQGASGRFP